MRHTLPLLLLLGVGACAEVPMPEAPPVVELGIIERQAPLDEALLVGHWDCHALPRGRGRAGRRTLREFAPDGAFRLSNPARPAEAPAQGEWMLDGAQLLVSDLEPPMPDSSGAVLMLTSRVLLFRAGQGTEAPLVSCSRA